MKIQKMFDDKVDLYRQSLNEFVVEQVDFDKKILDKAYRLAPTLFCRQFIIIAQL